MPMPTPFRKTLALAALCLVAAAPPLAGCSRRSAEAPPLAARDDSADLAIAPAPSLPDAPPLDVAVPSEASSGVPPEASSGVPPEASSGAPPEASSGAPTASPVVFPEPGTGRFGRATVPATVPETIVLNELRLMWLALDALERKGWNGSWGDPLPIAAADVSPAEVRRMVADEERKDGELTIPAEWEDLYVGDAARAEVQAELLAARVEYVAFLRERGVRAEYLEELDFVLPGDPRRMVYLGDNDPQAKPTATEPLVVDEATQEQDYSRLTLKVHGVDLWNGSDMCRDSRVLGPPTAAADALRAWHRDCRDFALRQTAYHELTHALQRAYVNRHLAPEERNRRASWSDASKALYTLERAWFWRWGGHDAVAAVANHAMADERQADGVSFQVLVRAGGLSDAQAKAVWDHWFGRLSDARDLLLRIGDRFDRQWPEYPADDFGGALFDVFSGQPGAQRMALKLSALPAYVGYLQPMRPEESDAFWRALREP
ncbi:MAG: hypothetical protein GYA57_05895 [Myxococcales bacterium]|nr:hypothetical protein [Myxococcales bacterium]